MMDAEEFRVRLGEVLRERKNAPLAAREIAATLRLRGKSLKKLQQWLHRMIMNGEIVRIHGNRFALGSPADLVTGIIEIVRSGNGFVTPAQGPGPDVFVSSDDTATALPGDKVLVRLYAGGRGEEPRRFSGRPAGTDREKLSRTGKVIRILERAQRELVGTLRSAGRFLCVVPIDPGYQHDFYVADAKDASVDDRVVIRFSGWENKHVNPEAEIVEILGPADRPSVDTVSILRHYDIRETFPTPALREAEAACALAEHDGARLDLRDRLILTIDPERARDFDDAVSLDRDEAGHWVLGVHIADVTHFVKADSALDKEARRRGNSVYLPDKVVPMLPEQLSNGVCSLVPGKDRLTVSAFITLDASGRAISRAFARSVIRSRHRLTYEQAMALLDGKAGEESGLVSEAMPLLRDIDALAQTLRRRRFEQYALDLDVPECEVEIDREGHMTGIRVVPNDRSHQLIEECMVAANEAVATELSRLGVPVIFRVHEKPSEEKIEELTMQLGRLGYKPGNLNDRKVLATFLKSVRDDPMAHHVRVAVLRSMKRALYSAECEGHFGLAKRYYSHFTSPIRRYPDLVLHRQLKECLPHLPSAEARGGGRKAPHPHAGDGGGEDAGNVPRAAAPYGKDDLAAIAATCSLTEQTADEAERALTEIKKFRFLAQQVEHRKPQTYEAVVLTVTNYGVFVELIDLQVQGLVHVSAMSDRFVRFNRSRGTLHTGRDVFGVGKAVRVYPTRVDLDDRQIDFALA